MRSVELGCGDAAEQSSSPRGGDVLSRGLASRAGRGGEARVRRGDGEEQRPRCGVPAARRKTHRRSGRVGARARVSVSRRSAAMPPTMCWGAGWTFGPRALRRPLWHGVEGSCSPIWTSSSRIFRPISARFECVRGQWKSRSGGPEDSSQDEASERPRFALWRGRFLHECCGPRVRRFSLAREGWAPQDAGRPPALPRKEQRDKNSGRQNAGPTQK